MKLIRVFSSTMPVTLARPYHWEVWSWMGVYAENGFSMPMLLLRYWPAA